MRIQFILKRNECYGFTTYTRRSAGLWNSTRFIAESLSARGVHVDMVEVADNNSIDKEVARFKPDICVIEALWVVPEKFKVLKKLHPHVKWFVHLHSQIPFLAIEGIAVEWILGYKNNGVGVIANSEESYLALKPLLECGLVYLENVYLMQRPERQPRRVKNYLDIGCFGAIRPLKNQLLQALAAVEFARQLEMGLVFHINGSRVETGGEPVLKNIRSLFRETKGTLLALHHWREHKDFLEFLPQLDIGMQVSLTETFNVVSADYVTAGLPMVVSKEVRWAHLSSKCREDDIEDIIRHMHRVYKNRCLVKKNRSRLLKHSAISQAAWYQFVREYA